MQIKLFLHALLLFAGMKTAQAPQHPQNPCDNKPKPKKASKPSKPKQVKLPDPKYATLRGRVTLKTDEKLGIIAKQAAKNGYSIK
jgi:hypothetical protein